MKNISIISKLGRHGLSATVGGVFPKVDMSVTYEVFYRESQAVGGERVDYYQLDLHFVWQDAFDVNAGLLSCFNTVLQLGKACKVG